MNECGLDARVEFQNPYRKSCYRSVLKGLFKPFKGKGEYSVFIGQILGMVEEVQQLMRTAVMESNREQYSQVTIVLVLQRVKSRWYLRWRGRDGCGMGAGLFRTAIEDPRLSNLTILCLAQLELLRVQLNFQHASLSQLAERAIAARAEIDRLQVIAAGLHCFLNIEEKSL